MRLIQIAPSRPAKPFEERRRFARLWHPRSCWACGGQERGWPGQARPSRKLERGNL